MPDKFCPGKTLRVVQVNTHWTISWSTLPPLQPWASVEWARREQLEQIARQTTPPARLSRGVGKSLKLRDAIWAAALGGHFVDPDRTKMHEVRWEVATQFSKDLLKLCDNLDEAIAKRDYYLFIDQYVLYQSFVGGIVMYASAFGALENPQSSASKESSIAERAVQLEIKWRHLNWDEFQRFYGRLDFAEKSEK